MAPKKFTVTIGNQTMVRPAAPSTAQNNARAGTSAGGLYYLSNLDLLTPSHMNTVYCYKPPSTPAPPRVASKLKDALEKVLAYYYPIAGRFVKGPDGRLAVDCTTTDDQQSGALFIEAGADVDMEDIEDIAEIDPTTLELLVSPTILDAYDIATICKLPPLIVQLTMFRCGGFAVGVRISHLMCDGIGAMAFLNSWGEIARGLPLTNPPYLDKTILKPRSPLAIEFPHPEYIKGPSTVVEECAALEYNHSTTRSYLFNLKQLSELKSKVSVDAPGEGGTYTSFEALAALVWRSWAVALGLGRRDSPTKDELCTLAFPVDGRTRFDPPLPAGFLGNAFLSTAASCRACDLVERPPSFAAGLVRAAIKKVTDAYLRSSIDCLEARDVGGSIGDDRTLIFGLWSRLEFYRLDFGWGEPMYAGPPAVPSRKFIILLPTRECADDGRRGVRIMLSLPEPAMLAFQEQIEGKTPCIGTGADIPLPCI